MFYELRRGLRLPPIQIYLLGGSNPCGGRRLTRKETRYDHGVRRCKIPDETVRVDGRYPEPAARRAAARVGQTGAAKRGNPGAINARGRAAVTDGTPTVKIRSVPCGEPNSESSSSR